MIYLDSAATTLQKPPAVARAVSSAVGRLATPGRGGHVPAMRAAETAFLCRQAAAELFQAESPEQVVFTSNATHGLNLAIHSLLKPGDAVVISGYEHNAVTRPLHALGVNIRVAAGPLFDPEAQVRAFERQLDETVRAVICNHVSNVFGFILPVEGIAALCRERGIPFVLDPPSRPGVCPSAWEAGRNALSPCRDTRDLRSPTGLLLCGAETHPLLMGGTGSASALQAMPDFLPDRLEAGTHNMPGIAGLLEGLRYVQTQGTERILTHERRLIRQAAAGLSRIPGVTVYGDGGAVQAGVLSFQIDGMDCEAVGEALGARGIAVRAGLHCAPLAHQSAGTLEAGTVRASVSAFNTPREVERFTQEVARLTAGQK
ncbi:MAG: aminotransferase class V-fold PLP-dependent enzyme [Flavonifractor plautii]